MKVVMCQYGPQSVDDNLDALSDDISKILSMSFNYEDRFSSTDSLKKRCRDFKKLRKEDRKKNFIYVKEDHQTIPTSCLCRSSVYRKSKKSICSKLKNVSSDLSHGVAVTKGLEAIRHKLNTVARTSRYHGLPSQCEKIEISKSCQDNNQKIAAFLKLTSDQEWAGDFAKQAHIKSLSQSESIIYELIESAFVSHSQEKKALSGTDLQGERLSRFNELKAKSCLNIQESIKEFCEQISLDKEEFFEVNTHALSLSRQRIGMAKDPLSSATTRLYSCLKKSEKKESALYSRVALEELSSFGNISEIQAVMQTSMNISALKERNIAVEESLPKLAKDLEKAKAVNAPKEVKEKGIAAIENAIQSITPFPIDFSNFNPYQTQKKLRGYNKIRYERDLNSLKDSLIAKRKKYLFKANINANARKIVNQIDRQLQEIGKEIELPNIADYPFEDDAYVNKSPEGNKSSSNSTIEPRGWKIPSRRYALEASDGPTNVQQLERSTNITGSTKVTDFSSRSNKDPDSSLKNRTSTSKLGNSSRSPASALTGPSVTGPLGGRSSAIGQSPNIVSESQNVLVYEYDQRNKALIICESLEDAKAKSQNYQYQEVYVFVNKKLLKLNESDIEEEYTIDDIKSGEVDYDVKEELIKLYPETFRYKSDDLNDVLFNTI